MHSESPEYGAEDLRRDAEEREAIREESDANGHDAEPDLEEIVEHRSDLGNAHRFARQHGESVRFAEKLGGYFTWETNRWQRDETGEVFRMMESTVRGIWQEVELATTKRERAELAGHALKSESAARIEAALRLARHRPIIAARPGDFDADPFVLNVQNGTIDLRTGELRSHRRADLLTKVAPVDYDPAARAPIFLAFLERIMDGRRELVRFLARAIGYSLTGDVREQVFFALYGIGENGKTTLVETLAAMLGDYAQAADFASFLARSNDQGARNDLARLVGARFVSAVEIQRGRRLDEAVVKQLSGGDTITARFLFREHFQFKPAFKLWFACNHRPQIRDTSRGMWRRVRLIPFDVTIPPAEQDKTLGAKLKAELPGILAWAVEGCLEWQADGLGVPEEVRAATDDYRAEMDVLGPFLDEHCIIDPEECATAAELFAAYKAWCEATEERAENQRRFGMGLAERGFTRRKDRRGRYEWRGIGVRRNPQ